jgi:methylated-DNA-[protein]-cysteine S-methyltransferase
MTYSHHDSPIGRLLLAAESSGLVGLWIEGKKHAPAIGDSWVARDNDFSEAHRQLEAYFAGRRTQFDLPVGTQGTQFQQRVWAELRRIPHGQTRSYAQLANALGQPKAVRAVGMANSRNPICIIVPCHRVIGSDGSLTGYAGGVEAKAWLLKHEARPS